MQKQNWLTGSCYFISARLIPWTLQWWNPSSSSSHIIIYLCVRVCLGFFFNCTILLSILISLNLIASLLRLSLCWTKFPLVRKSVNLLRLACSAISLSFLFVILFEGFLKKPFQKPCMQSWFDYQAWMCLIFLLILWSVGAAFGVPQIQVPCWFLRAAILHPLHMQQQELLRYWKLKTECISMIGIGDPLLPPLTSSLVRKE